MGMSEGFLRELEQESAATRRMLERVPGDKLSWKPHEKSLSLGQLAFHVASNPGFVAQMLQMDEMPVPPDRSALYPEAESADVLIPTMEEGLAAAKATVGDMDDAALMGTWRMMDGDREVWASPKVGLVRGIMLNHWYHHRAQLGVYLRLLDVPVPSVYGPTADEDPWAEA